MARCGEVVFHRRTELDAIEEVRRLQHREKDPLDAGLEAILARRVVTRVRPGSELKAGERVGLMKFGSRMDVFLPPSAELKVKVGDTVVGGVTVIAILKSPTPNP